MKVTVEVQGLREVDAALADFKAVTAKAIARRTLTAALKPIIETARANVRVLSGALRDSMAVGTKLTRRQSRANVKESDVEVYGGAGGLTEAITEEFGTERQAAHPFLRPAWDAGADQALEDIKSGLWVEIKKTADRAARRSAKLQAKG